MREMTSAVANKLLKKYNQELEQLYKEETECATYTEIDGIAPIVPTYDFSYTRAKVETLIQKILAIKHAINKFNAETPVFESERLTIDQALVFMAILNKEKSRLEGMITPVTKKLKSGFGVRNNQVEYEVINYNVDDVRSTYSDICEKLTKLQVQLDIINSTILFDVPGLPED